MNASRLLLLIPLSLISLGLPMHAQATGFNFWEGSALNSALANANGARARDASVQAMVPASITQLKMPIITASITHYQVDTDYKIFGNETEYSVANPIPSGFFSAPINDDWYFGLAIHSRAAADISVPSIILVHPDEARLKPITVSIAPTIAYKAENISIALTGEYLVSEHELHQTQCRFNRCETEIETGNASGVSGAVSATWQINSLASVALMHRFDAQLKNNEIDILLPAITSIYTTIELVKKLDLDLSYSLSRWKGKGIKFTNYSDVLGLLQGYQDSNRFAAGLEYQIEDWFLRAGFSSDEAIDPLGGYDKRYRIGAGYQATSNIHLNLSAFKEIYAIKKFSTNNVDLVRVQNKGQGLSLGMSYQF